MSASGAGDRTDHYFSEQPTVASQRSTVTLTLPDFTANLVTDRGVFSAGRIDPGTKLLLLEAAQAPAAAEHLLDLGCGYGPIAVPLATRHPNAIVWAIDSNERARELCNDNAAQLGLDHIRCVAPDDVPADIRFDYVCGNPPIRIGKEALHQLLRDWLGRLSPSGVAHLVVQKHLGSDSLARWLIANGNPTERLRSRSGYRILEVQPASALS